MFYKPPVRVSARASSKVAYYCRLSGHNRHNRPRPGSTTADRVDRLITKC